MDELICRDCCEKKDATEFRPRRAGGLKRTLQCRACHCQAEKLRRAAKRSRHRRQAVNWQLARLKRAKSARQIAAVCEELIRCFGGLEGFTVAWKGLLDADLARGGFAALRHLEAVLRLVHHCEHDRPDYSQLTDEQLQELANALERG